MLAAHNFDKSRIITKTGDDPTIYRRACGEIRTMNCGESLEWASFSDFNEAPLVIGFKLFFKKCQELKLEKISIIVNSLNAK